MAFGTLEDLEDKLELVFFPRTWAAVREIAIIDQVMLVTGKVQADNERLSLLVDRVQTKFDYHQPVEDQPPWESSAPPAPPAPSRVIRESTPQKGYPPPPPPNYEADWHSADPDNGAPVRPTNGAKHQSIPARSALSPTPSEQGMVIISIDPAGDWQQTIRIAANLAGEHQGGAILALALKDRPLAMELPNRPVAYTPQLKAELEALPGVVSVSAR